MTRQRPPDGPRPGGGDAGRREGAPPLDPLSVDVGRIVRRTVTSLYSHLVTRPTGRAVRLAIESRIAEAGGRTLSLVDLSEVRVLDFSCADEVVAKLLLGASDAPPRSGAFFVFRGVRDAHRDPIEEVLLRQSLSAVAETGGGRYELLGERSDEELRVWRLLEEAGRVGRDRVATLLPDRDERRILARLARRRVVLEVPERGEYRALSTLVPPPP